MIETGEFQPSAILEVLHKHGVRYVLIGGLAAVLHGATTPTFDVDITPQATKENLTRLSAALRELEARIRVDGIPEGLPFSHDAASLAGFVTLNLVTNAGDLDIAMHPAGIESFADWDRDAVEIVIMDIPVRVADLESVIRSKEAADRPKDRQALPMLRALLVRLKHGDESI